MFNGFNGNTEKPDGMALSFNILAEQLIILRADMSALHGCVQILATKHGMTVEEMQALRIQFRNASYEKVCADVLQMLKGGSGAGAAPHQP